MDADGRRGRVRGQPDSDPRETVSRSTRRTPTPYPGWAVALGLFVAGAGGFVVVAGAREVGRGQAPGLVAMAGLFVLAGLWLAGYAGVYHVRKRRSRRAGLAPWARDRRWDPSGASDDGVRRTVRILVAVTAVALFLVPFHMVVLADPPTGPAAFVVWSVLGLFDLAVLLGFGTVGYRVAQRLRYGGTRLDFGDFPFRPGGSVDVTFRGPPELDGAEMTARLLCLREVYRGGAGDGSPTLEHQVLHDQGLAFHLRGGLTARLAFELPEDVPGTDYWAESPRYWELEVRAETTGVDFRALFPVPVYRG